MSRLARVVAPCGEDALRRAVDEAHRRYTFDKSSEYTIQCPRTPKNVFIKLAVPGD